MEMDRDTHYAHDARYAEPDNLEDGIEKSCDVCDLVGCLELHEFYDDEPYEPKCWGQDHPAHRARECMHFEREPECRS